MNHLGLLRMALEDAERGVYQPAPGCASVSMDDLAWAINRLDRLDVDEVANWFRKHVETRVIRDDREFDGDGYRPSFARLAEMFVEEFGA